ncbi:MAG: COX15/CtaA family protein, partial [Candidatus Eremiobacteraeota bacterium]|nr:COX15/CtaA family protein [Candidatus Eremiobacteraeota bacterium]
MLGSWTRINAAGMTCPDYPLCRGRFIPAFAGGTVWEWTHRLMAVLLCAVVIALLAAAWRRRKEAPFVPALAAVVALLFAVQVALGALTVHLANSPASVVWHWGTAMAFAGTLTAMTIAARTTSPHIGADYRLAWVLWIVAAIAFITMCIGAYVSASGAGLACVSIPGCAGNVVVYTHGQYVQMVHRFAAAICLLSAAAVAALSWVWGANVRTKAAVGCGLVFIFLQVLLGLMNVALRLPMELREAHAANA